MILSVRVNNFLVYSNDTELSLIPDLRIKKFMSNVYNTNKFSALKTSCIYGGNNVGKTCMLRAINSIRNVLLSAFAEIPVNIFSKNNVCSLGITFLHENKAYSYDFKFDTTRTQIQYCRGFIYEKFSELNIDKYGNLSEKELFVRDMDSDNYFFRDNEELSKLLKLVSSNNILIYTINSEKYAIIETYRNILREFASKIDIVDMNNIPLEKTIAMLKNNDLQIKNKIVELIKNADIDIDDFKFNKNPNNNEYNDNAPLTPQEIVLRASNIIDDMYRLTSIHKGVPVQSVIFDSTGTKKMIAISSYIVESLLKGRVLVVDEIDSSLHFKLTRAIVALFNNELNINAQLIFTTHDITLLDCKKLLRKDQINFATKDEDGVTLYSLKTFTAAKYNIRSESDLIEKYKHGEICTIPEPDLINILLGDE